MNFSPNEITRKLPPLMRVSDDHLFRETCRVVHEHCPEYFWEAPAATTLNHHNPYSCNERGLWIHTLMVCTAYSELVETYTYQDRISDYEAECGLVACVLHDMRKYGDEHWEGKTAARDHDIQMADIVYDRTDLPDLVAGAIHAHMGGWYEGNHPSTDLHDVVHAADMVASTKNGTFGIQDKPEEITELYPSLPEADH